MRMFMALIVALLFARVGFAAPLQLHNRLVFTRKNQPVFKDGHLLPIPTMTVWTMNSDGGDQKQVWGVPYGYGVFGGFSRDGKWALSFNDFNLYRHDLQTKRIQRVLVWSGGWGTGIEQPSFSPDGKQIMCVIVGMHNNYHHSRLLRFEATKSYSINDGYAALMTHQVKVKGNNTPEEDRWSEPRWNKDGNQIVAVAGYNDFLSREHLPGHELELWIMNIDGSGAQQLTNNKEWDSMPSFSPDGRKIAFVRAPDTEDSDLRQYASNLWILDLTRKKERALTFNVYNEIVYYERVYKQKKSVNIQVKTPLFSPDGNQIAFQQDGIYCINTDGTHQKRLGDGELVQWVW